MNNKVYLVVLLISAFIIRVVNPTVPFFTTDEARIAYRGHTLSTRDINWRQDGDQNLKKALIIGNSL